jgi:hypothetical protein
MGKRVNTLADKSKKRKFDGTDSNHNGDFDGESRVHGLNAGMSEGEFDLLLKEALKEQIHFDESRFTEGLRKRLEECDAPVKGGLSVDHMLRGVLSRLRELLIFSENPAYRVAAVIALSIFPVLYFGYSNERSRTSSEYAADPHGSEFGNRDVREIVPAVPINPESYSTVQVAPRTFQYSEDGPPRFDYETRLIDEMNHAPTPDERLAAMRKLSEYYEKTGQPERVEGLLLFFAERERGR